MNIKELRNKTKMTQKEFAEHFNIPKRTIENWEGGKRNPPEYVVELIEYKIKKEMEEMLKEKLERLEELKGEEMTLLEMDNKVQEILESESSIFDGETEEWIEDREFAYTTWKDEPVSETVDINIHFTVLEESENSLETVVRINDIEEL